MGTFGAEDFPDFTGTGDEMITEAFDESSSLSSSQSHGEAAGAKVGMGASLNLGTLMPSSLRRESIAGSELTLVAKDSLETIETQISSEMKKRVENMENR